MDVNKLRTQAESKARDLQGKAQDFLKDHSDQIESGVTKAEQFAKSKTKSERQSARIDKVAGKLRGIIPDDEPGSTPPPPPPPAS